MRKLNLISLGIYSAIASSVAVANSLPKNHTIQSGQANVIDNNGDMIIQQSTPRVKIDWESFDIGQSNSVTFQQPSDVAVAYNRVTGGNASQIHGKLEANGRVFLANPNGVIFGKDASVNVGALLATTKELAANQNDFDNATELTFEKSQQVETEGEILNQGKLTATGKQNGFIALIGNQVKNEGTITANNYSKSTTENVRICSAGPEYTLWCDQGLNGAHWINDTRTTTISTPAQVFLGVGNGFTLDLDDRNNAISVSLTNSDVERLIENKGMIVANNGDITLTAGGRSQVIDTLINNEGILEANSVSERNGTITLGASKINLGSESQLKADGTLTFKSPKSSFSQNHQVSIKAEKGAVISAKETAITADKLHFEGEFDRGTEKRFFSDEFGSKNSFKFDGKGVVQVSDEKPEDFEGNFISSSALSSILASHGKSVFNLGLLSVRIDGQRKLYQGELKIDNANLNVEAFQNSDSLLKINAPKWTMNNTNITSTGRLTLVQDINYRAPSDEAGTRFNNVTLDLANGSLGVGRSERQSYYYLNSPANSVEEEARDKTFDVNWQQVTLNRVDDIVIAGGFRNVDIDGLTHSGRANLYIHGGNSRIWRPEIPATDTTPLKKAQYGWEYAIQNIEERVTRSRRNHDCPRCKRWNYSADLADNYLAREFFDTYDMWNVTQNRKHLETRINISNSNIKTHHGFVHLMAKNINLKDSNLDISFERDLTFDSLQRRIHKLGLNGETVLDNTHIKIVGPEANNTAPDSRDGAAGMFVLGELLGKNSSTVFAKMQQGYTLRTDGNTKLKGETGQDDLKLTLVNTGTTQDLNISITADQPNEGNTAFSPGDARGTKTVLENVTLNLIAPNGAPAYYSSDAIPIEIKDSKVSVFEQPRTQRAESATFSGDEAKTISLEEATNIVNDLLGVQPEAPAPADSVPPVAETPVAEHPIAEAPIAQPATPPVVNSQPTQPAPAVSNPQPASVSQVSFDVARAVAQQSTHSVATTTLIDSITPEKTVEVEICQEGEECESLSIGETEVEGKVSVGELQ